MATEIKTSPASVNSLNSGSENDEPGNTAVSQKKMKRRCSTDTNLTSKTLEMQLAILRDKFAALEQRFNDFQETESINGEDETGKGTDASVDNAVCDHPGRIMCQAGFQPGQSAD